MSLAFLDITDTAGQHNRLVVTVASSADVRLECTEITENIRASEFIIESGASSKDRQS